MIETENGKVTYLNSGDWIEHLTSLEYYNKEWHIYQYDESNFGRVVKNRMNTEADVISDEIHFYLHSLHL